MRPRRIALRATAVRPAGIPRHREQSRAMSRQELEDDEWPSFDETHADKFFFAVGIPWRERSAEWCAAHFSHRIYCFSLKGMRFADPEREEWARRFLAILFDKAEINRARREHLTPQERRQVLREVIECEREMRALEQGNDESELRNRG